MPAIPFVSAHEGATVIRFLRALSMQTVPAGRSLLEGASRRERCVMSCSVSPRRPMPSTCDGRVDGVLWDLCRRHAIDAAPHIYEPPRHRRDNNTRRPPRRPRREFAAVAVAHPWHERAGGAGLFSQECTSKVTICNKSKDWAEIASITKADVMALCEDTEVRHWFEEAAHQENFLVRAAAKRSPSEESVQEEAVRGRDADLAATTAPLRET